MSDHRAVYSCRITSATPLLLHNGALADPTNETVKAMKRITDKRGKKTEADYEEMSRLEWYGSLYFHNGCIVLPADMIEACLTAAAKTKRKGIQAKTGITVSEHAVLQYDGPKDIDEMWKSGDFVHKVGVRVQKNRVIRTRPVFREWSADLTIEYLPGVLNKSDVDEFVKLAGMQVGLGDWRPKYGRFSVGFF